MPVSVTMPQLGESVTEGTVTRWLKAEGDTVEADEPLLEVSTDKVDTEIPSPASGVLTRIVAGEDAVVQVGGELAVIGDAASGNDGGDKSADGQEASAASAQPEQPQPEQPQPEQSQPEQSQPEQSQPEEPQPEEPQPEQSQPAAAADSGASGEGTAVVLPALGESVTEGTVTRWLKAVGDEVAADEALLEVSTDKVDTEIPSPAAGTLLSIDVDEDETVQVGAVLGRIGSAGVAATPASEPSSSPAAQDTTQAQAQESAQESSASSGSPFRPGPSLVSPPVQSPQPTQPAQPAQPAEQPEPAEPAEPAQPQAEASSPAGSDGSGASDSAAEGTYVTPLVRKLAAEHSVDLSTVTGTGVGGRIRKQDVLEAAANARTATVASTPPPPAANAGEPAPRAKTTAPETAASALRGRTEPMSRLRKVIAERMVSSLQTSAQLTSVVEVDVSRIASLRQRAKADFEAREGVKLSFLPFFAKATIEALRSFPQLNASIDPEAGTVSYHEAEHLGVAVDTDRGLLVPVIRDAGDLNIAGLARKINDLADRTRNNKITPDELSGGTFTLTNTGSRGALFDTPIINQPQVGILGTGAVVRRPVVVTDETGGDVIAVRSMVYLALTYDHRLVDGADAARFLTALKARLEEGAFESDLGL